METSDHIPGEFQNLFKGEVHIALPLTLSDQKDYMVRNITGIDADEGSITISEAVGTGDSIQFMERNDETL
ncbi:MAG: hypothetical protein GWN30_25690, partial [Gammaproteobacteria bacterium]|nr:hypothetical protein [Phycisphaerae bacterium]NIW48017.1 hypothetical protein [Gammaproteobacteria bacterium]